MKPQQLSVCRCASGKPCAHRELYVGHVSHRGTYFLRHNDRKLFYVALLPESLKKKCEKRASIAEVIMLAQTIAEILR